MDGDKDSQWLPCSDQQFIKNCWLWTGSATLIKNDMMDKMLYVNGLAVIVLWLKTTNYIRNQTAVSSPQTDQRLCH